MTEGSGHWVTFIGPELHEQVYTFQGELSSGRGESETHWSIATLRGMPRRREWRCLMSETDRVPHASQLRFGSGFRRV